MVNAVSQVSGAIWRIDVRVGDRVGEEDMLGVVEAMKMEIPILAPCAGVLSAILKGEGETVQEGEAVMVVDPSG